MGIRLKYVGPKAMITRRFRAETRNRKPICYISKIGAAGSLTRRKIIAQTQCLLENVKGDCVVSETRLLDMKYESKQHSHLENYDSIRRQKLEIKYNPRHVYYAHATGCRAVEV